MTRPGIITYLFGNPISALLVALAAIAVVIAAIGGNATGIAAFSMIAVAIYAGSCFQKVEAYRLWKKAMNGISSKKPMIATLPKGKQWVAGTLWLVMACFAIGGASSPDLQGPVALFWLGSFLMLAAAVFRRFKGSKKPARASKREVAVSVCLRVPMKSVPFSQTYNALPDYCQRLIKR